MASSSQQRFEEYVDILRKYPAAAKTIDTYQNSIGFQNETEQLYVTACAPSAVIFVKWVLQQALQKGIKRLYFLARDGYPFYVAAGHLCQAWKLDIDCRYLSVSRYAVRVPEYHLMGKACLERICIGGIDVTFEKIMKRAALTDEEAMHVAELVGCKESYQSILNYQQILNIKQKLMDVDCLFEYINSHSKEAYENAIGYLTQEGLLEEVPYAIVDSGWVGTLQQSMQRLLRTKKKSLSLEGFYFGLYELPQGAERDLYHAYFFEPYRGLKRKVHFSNCLFEAIYSATEGMTLCYRAVNTGAQVTGTAGAAAQAAKDKADRQYVPVLDSRQNRNWEQLAQNTAVLVKYVKVYTMVAPVFAASARKDLKMVQELLGLFMSRPSMLEIQTYGNQVFSDDVLEHDMKTVAARLSDEDIRNQRLFRKLLIIFGIRKGVLRESAWLEASVVLNDIDIDRYLRHVAIYKYFVYIKKMLKRH